MRTPALGPRCGATLIEMVTVLVVLAILTGLAAPSLSRWIAVQRVNTALGYVRGDIYYARMLAVRSGEWVEMRFQPAERFQCVTHYEVVVLATPERVAKRVRVAEETRGVCLSHNSTNPLIFNTRGIPRGVAARTFRAAAGGVEATLTLSQAGRLYRDY